MSCQICYLERVSYSLLDKLQIFGQLIEALAIILFENKQSLSNGLNTNLRNDWVGRAGYICFLGGHISYFYVSYKRKLKFKEQCRPSPACNPTQYNIRQGLETSFLEYLFLLYVLKQCTSRQKRVKILFFYQKYKLKKKNDDGVSQCRVSDY